MGLHQAGYDVTGVDIKPQPHYPFRFIQADAMTFPLDDYDLVWASPPCQHYTRLGALHRAQRQSKAHAAYVFKPWEQVDLLAPTRARLQALPGAWVIENVDCAPMQRLLLLCGQMFGLPIIRHRYFESSHMLLAPPHPKHPKAGDFYMIAGHMKGRIAQWCAAMEITWHVTRAECSQMIPPAYSRFIAHQIRGDGYGTTNPRRVVGLP
jgi:DNA (cytosine-5)-methyltransferase 1